jgi:uncharacterized protein
MAFLASDAIEVKRTRGKGLGVFARRRIRDGEVIETCPVLVLPAAALGEGPGGLWAYGFDWSRGTVALALGFGSLYNHSFEPNARYDDMRLRAKRFTALRDIAEGEEITVNYNGEPSDRSKVWFDVVGDRDDGAIEAVRTADGLGGST